jgi:predicted nuclease of predicted toxin-antitoxin system
LKLKLDENLGVSCTKLLREAGHDVATVPEENLCGAEDEALISACQSEKRVLVTLDLDFGNPLLFKPSLYEGIVVIRLPSRSTLSDLTKAIRTLIGGLKTEKIQGELWIVHHGRIRVFQEE